MTAPVAVEPAPFPLDEYLERIGIETWTRTGTSDGCAATLDRLEAVQRAQAYTIPFENFDIALGRGVSLAPDHLVEKIIRSKRGGYCFELNGLFLRAICALGFEARALLARVHVGGETSARTHQLSLVAIDGSPFVSDVGFGGMCPRAPIPLEFDRESDHDGTAYRLREHELGYLLQVEQAEQTGGWLDLYSFDLGPVVPADIECGNHFAATHPSSFFTNSRIASLAYPDGRAGLFNHRCMTTRAGREEVDEFPDGAGYLPLLEERFGIVLDARYDELAPIF